MSNTNLNNNADEAVVEFLNETQRLSRRTVTSVQDLEQAKVFDYNVLNNGKIFTNHISVDNATIGQTADEVFVLYPLYSNVELARTVLKKAFGTKGFKSQYSPLSKREGVFTKEIEVIEISAAVIKETVDSMRNLDFDKLSDDAVRLVIEDLGHAKNGESQIVIDAAKKFFTAPQSVNLLNSVRLMSKSNKLEFNLIADEDRYAFDVDAANKALEERNSKYTAKHYKLNDYISVNVDARDTFEERNTVFVNDPMQQAKLDSLPIIGKAAAVLMGNYYKKVQYSESMTKQLDEIVGLYSKDVVEAFVKFEGMYRFLTRMLMQVEQIMFNQRADKNETDAEKLIAVKTAVRSSRNFHYGMLSDAVYSTLGNKVTDPIHFGALALYASYGEGKWDIHPGTFATTLFSRQVYLTHVSIMGTHNSAGTRIAEDRFGEQIEVNKADTFEDGQIIEIDANNLVVGTNSRVIRNLDAGTYTVAFTDRGVFATQKLASAFEEKMKATNDKVAMFKLSTDFLPEEVKDANDLSIDIDYKGGEELIAKINEYSKSDTDKMFVTADRFFGFGLFVEREDGEIELVSQIKSHYNETINKFLHRRYVKVLKTFTASLNKEFDAAVFVEIEGLVDIDNTPKVKTYLNKETEEVIVERKPAFVMSAEDMTAFAFGSLSIEDVLSDSVELEEELKDDTETVIAEENNTSSTSNASGFMAQDDELLSQFTDEDFDPEFLLFEDDDADVSSVEQD